MVPNRIVNYYSSEEESSRNGSVKAAPADVTGAIERSREDVDQIGIPQGSLGAGMMVPNLASFLIKTGDLIPPWWSVLRDREMDRLIKKFDHLSGVKYNAETKLANIPLSFVARDQTITAHVELAEKFTQRITMASELGQGFRVAYKKFIGDYLVADNGGFMEILGEGELDGPLVGLPWSVRHLDSHLCTRTGDPEFPVIVDDPKSKSGKRRRFKLHMSRVIFLSQQPSSRTQMNGVGFSAASRSFQLGQVLADQLVYKLEKMGSRPTTQLLVGNNMNSSEIIKSFMMAEELMAEIGLQRYAKTIAIGGEDVSMQKIDLNEFAPFDEETGTLMAIYALAFIWGLDIRDLWPVSSSKGAEQSANMRARGKLPADFTADMSDQFDFKLCPPMLKAEYDFKDDDEDQQAAVSRDIRARRRERLAKAGLMDEESELREMVRDGDLSREDFARRMLDNGRLEDGSPVAALFWSQDELVLALVTLPGFDEPTIVERNDVEDIREAIHGQQALCYAVLGEVRSLSQRKKTLQSLGALEWLEKEYESANKPPVNIIPPGVNPFGEEDLDEEE